MGNTYANLLYHAVFSTKDREPLIDERWQDDLYAYMGGIVRGSRGTLLKSGGVADHVHLLLKLPASVAIADMLRLVKANSSNWVRDSKLVIGKFAWQAGYGAFTVSKSQVPDVERYIQNQAAHRRGRSFQEEFLALLERHGIEYDPRYLWD
jgi:REP element-mobilizing transposase RayT